MATSIQADKRIDTEEFIAWCEQQAEQSQDSTSRIIVADDEMVKFRLREFDSVEDITLVKGKNVDTIRFEKGGRSRQFHAHRRDITLHAKTLIVRAGDGQEICRAGTGTRNKKGPFPL